MGFGGEKLGGSACAVVGFDEGIAGGGAAGGTDAAAHGGEFLDVAGGAIAAHLAERRCIY